MESLMQKRIRQEKEREAARQELIRAFRAFSRCPSGRARDAAWDNYVEKRETFLKIDCQIRGVKYVPLSATVIDSQDVFGHAAKKILEGLH